MLKLRPVLPFVALLSGAVLLAVSPWWALAAAGLYALVTLMEAARVGRGLPLAGVATAWLVFPVLQFSQAIGFGIGLLAQALENAGFKAVDALDRRTAWAVGPSYRPCWARTKLNCSVDCGECCVSALSPDFTLARVNDVA